MPLTVSDPPVRRKEWSVRYREKRTTGARRGCTCVGSHSDLFDKRLRIGFSGAFGVIGANAFEKAGNEAIPLRPVNLEEYHS